MCGRATRLMGSWSSWLSCPVRMATTSPSSGSLCAWRLAQHVSKSGQLRRRVVASPASMCTWAWWGTAVYRSMSDLMRTTHRLVAKHMLAASFAELADITFGLWIAPGDFTCFPQCLRRVGLVSPQSGRHRRGGSPQRRARLHQQPFVGELSEWPIAAAIFTAEDMLAARQVLVASVLVAIGPAIWPRTSSSSAAVALIHTSHGCTAQRLNAVLLHVCHLFGSQKRTG